MHIDVSTVVGAAIRSVETRTHEGREARVVVAARDYDTTIEDLWDALTNPERIPRWFLPVSGDLRVGGRYQLHGNAGGTITHCEPPRAVAMTWEFGKQVTWVEVRLQTVSSGRTNLELEHITQMPDPHWDQFGPGATGVGWDMALTGLGLYLAAGVPNDPQAWMAWMTSDNGKEFVRHASADWYRASIASGADEGWARAAADRTTAAYTGEPANDQASNG